MKAFLSILVAVSILMFASCDISIGSDVSDDKPTGPLPKATMTPYLESRSPDEYYAGATFDLEATGRSLSAISQAMEDMKAININTITIYGFENESRSVKEHIFEELDRLGMKIVIRIESYDKSTFDFGVEDAADVVSAHSEIIEFVSRTDRRDSVAYFALNMPVDDGDIQSKFPGGINSQEWREDQVSYADELVRLMREELSKHGFGDAKLYLSVHYGWDNSYNLLSYESAGADGYFINCYSYPYLHGGDDGRGDTQPTEDDPVEQLIDVNQIDRCMAKYKAQYHTMEYNNWEKTDQTAGLVWDRDAKRKAMQETIKYYEEEYPFVEGAMYFGYNLLKVEGSDGAVMDWTLVY